MPSFISSVPYPQIPASFNYVGSNQNFVVPAGITRITVYMWGAGGGGTTTQYGATLGPGGTGAFVTGQISVTPGQTLYVLVGQGGGGMQGYYQTKLSPGGFPGGGNGYYAPGGGGYSGIFISSTPSQSNALIVAGAGGGAVVDGLTYGGSATNVLGTAQNGGNRNNGNETTTPGLGATATGGGAGGTPPPVGFGTGSAGAALKGGDGCTTDTSANNYGGGGGAGYWGGGGGSSFGGGGGGNSYANSTYVTNFTGASTQSSLTTAVSAPGSNNPYYQAGIAASAAGQNGGNGLVVITYPKPPTGSLQTFLTKQVYPSQGPLSVTGCVMWLDGADPAGTGTAPSNGASVSTWVDKSGSNNSGTAGSAATYSASERALLFGTGTGSAAGYSQNAWPSGNYYTTPYTANPTNETCYLVFNLPVIGYGFAISGHSCGGRSFATPTSGGYPTTTQLLGGVNCYSWGVTASSSIYANTTYIGKLITNANNQYGSINGSNMAGPTAQSPGSVTTDIGAQNANSIYFNGYIKEILFYNRVLSSNEQLTVQAYLANKWNITASLPAGHPTSTAITPTGQVTTFMKYLPYPPFPTHWSNTTSSAWTSYWQPYLQQLVTANANAAVSFNSGGITGSTPTGYAYIGGVLAPNGKIYCITCLATTIGVIDPIANTLTYPVSGTVIGNDAYDAGGVLGPDGKIYCIPSFNTAPVGVIDPIANTFTTFGTSISGAPYCGGVLAPNGKIYCIPFNSTTVGVIDPVALTLTSPVTGTAPGSGAYYGGVLAPNGKIYCIPYNATSIGVIDPVANTFSTPLSGSSPGSTAYYGGVLAPNGKIYCIPRSANTIGIIDPVANTFSTTSVSGTKPTGYVYYGGALAPNGKIYLVPRYASDSANSIGVIDPVANTFTTIGGASAGTDLYAGAVLAPNGKIYFIPWQASTPAVLTISCSQLPSSNYCLSAYVNKF